MDKKSILIGALGASLLFVSIGAGISSSENAHESHQWIFSHDRKEILNVKTGEWRTYTSEGATKTDSLGREVRVSLSGYFTYKDIKQEFKRRGCEDWEHDWMR